MPGSPLNPTVRWTLFYRSFREWDDKGVVERCAFLGHHITAMVSFMWILETNQLLYFANHRLMAEWSTPLLNAVLLSDHFPNLPFIVKDILKGMDLFSRQPMIYGPYNMGYLLTLRHGDPIETRKTIPQGILVGYT